MIDSNYPLYTAFVLRRISLMLCILMTWNGSIDVVRCESDQNASHALSFFGDCVCHNEIVPCGFQSPTKAVTPDTDGNDAVSSSAEDCSDIVVAELDPTHNAGASLAAPTCLDQAVLVIRTVRAPVGLGVAQRAFHSPPRARLIVLRI